MFESVRHSFAIAQTTLREVLRGKVLFASFGSAALLIGVMSLFGTVTIGDQVKVIMDFGLFTVSLFPVGFAVLSGTTLLHQELSKKTVYNILSKPVHRSEFVTGKFLGMLATSSVLLALIAGSLSLFLLLFGRHSSFDLFEAYLLSWFELVIVCGLAIFFSSLVVTPALSGLFTFGVFLAGRSTDYLLYFINEGVVKGPARYLLDGLYWILPRLHSLYVSNGIVHSHRVSTDYIVWSGLYSLGYTALLVLFAQILFRKRDFN